MERMTIRQLTMVTNERVFICSIYDISQDVELTTELRAYTGILTLEILTLTHHEEGFTAAVDLPAAAIAGLKRPE